jgi:hypothetical protein
MKSAVRCDIIASRAAAAEVRDLGEVAHKRRR